MLHQNSYLDKNPISFVMLLKKREIYKLYIIHIPINTIEKSFYDTSDKKVAFINLIKKK